MELSRQLMESGVTDYNIVNLYMRVINMNHLNLYAFPRRAGEPDKSDSNYSLYSFQCKREPALF